jgi:hypothetical protein
MLTRDIENELAAIHNAKLSKRFTQEEAEREEILLRDLEQVQAYIGKEIWELEETERL